MTDLPKLLATARGDAPADLVLRNVRVVNVFTGEIEPPADLAICGDRIAGWGGRYNALESIDGRESFVAPGLIDAHVHIESSLCVPAEFAAAVVPRGVTTVVADPHEIANVAGEAAVRWMHEVSRGLPLSVVLMGPSCVPATTMSTAGARLDAAALRSLRDDGIIHGLAEVMNFPGVVSGDAEMLAKLDALRGRPIDGHCPSLTGRALDAYVAAGIGSDHECVTLEEAQAKLSRGQRLLIREATNARNLDALLPLIVPPTERRICFCTDDRTPVDLINEGTIDSMVRRAIAAGVDVVTAVRCATLNTAEWFGLHDRGAIMPGRRADVVVFDDANVSRAKLVIAGGKLVARDGRLIEPPRATVMADSVRGRCEVDLSRVSFAMPMVGRVRVIGVVPEQLITRHLVEDAAETVGRCTIAVIDRHTGSGRVGLGFVRGFGLSRGAIAGTVAHDHHNLIIIGADEASMRTAARAVARVGGGLAVSTGDRVIAELPLPIAGLMSDRPIAEVAGAYATLCDAAHGLGCTATDPFMAMSFLGLEVIPSLKLTDRGLVDVEKFELVELCVEGAN